MGEIIYRAANEADIPALLALYRAVYGREPSGEFYRWKFFAPVPACDGPRLWLAEAQGRVVSSAGALPHRFWLDGHELLNATLMEYHLAKEFRGKGVQSRLHVLVNADLARRGTTYTCMMPNQMSRNLALNVHHTPLFRALWLRRASWILPAAFARPPGNRTVRPLDLAGTDCGVLWARLRNRVNACSIPSADWLRYRYADCPGRNYDFLLAENDAGPCGLWVLGSRPFGKRREACVAYAIAANEDADTWRALAAAAVRRACRLGLRGVRALLPEAPEQQARWQALGFRSAPGDFVFHARDTRDLALPASLQSPEVFVPWVGDHDFI